MKHFCLLLAISCAIATVALSCHTIDDNRIPVAPVNIVFNTSADWDIYGVAAATDHRRFIRDQRIPANFPYTATTFTGYGGILLVCDVMGAPLAYDLSCPVEAKTAVRVQIDPESLLAVCPVCGSTYDVLSLQGAPTSGIAAERGYGMRRYRVGQGQAAFKVVSY